MEKHKPLMTQQPGDYIQYNHPTTSTVITEDMSKINPFGKSMKYEFIIANGDNVISDINNPYAIMTVDYANKKDRKQESEVGYVLSYDDMIDLKNALDIMIIEMTTCMDYRENAQKKLKEFIATGKEYEKNPDVVKPVYQFHEITQLDPTTNYRLVRIRRLFNDHMISSAKEVHEITINMYLTGLLSVDMENICKILELTDPNIEYDNHLKQVGMKYYASAQKDAVKAVDTRMKRGDSLHFVPNRRK